MQTPQMLPPTPSQLRPSAVPLLWQGASPFEYRGLEAESDDETPRGTAVAGMTFLSALTHVLVCTAR